MKSFSKLISILLHPIFLTSFGMAYLLFVSDNPILEVPVDKRMQWLLITLYSTLFMPLLVVFLLWRLKFIQSLEMKTTKERYVPLIACMSFYFWVFWIFHLNLGASGWIKMFLLASFISMVLLFLFTIFNKVSLHVGASAGVLVYALLLNSSTGFQDLLFLGFSGMAVLLIIWSRKSLQAHTQQQLIMGGVLGSLASLISFFIF
jgi:membrane-associated phospholipid phosphatase